MSIQRGFRGFGVHSLRFIADQNLLGAYQEQWRRLHHILQKASAIVFFAHSDRASLILSFYILHQFLNGDIILKLDCLVLLKKSCLCCSRLIVVSIFSHVFLSLLFDTFDSQSRLFENVHIVCFSCTPGKTAS